MRCHCIHYVITVKEVQLSQSGLNYGRLSPDGVDGVAFH